MAAGGCWGAAAPVPFSGAGEGDGLAGRGEGSSEGCGEAGAGEVMMTTIGGAGEPCCSPPPEGEGEGDVVSSAGG